MDDHTTMGTRLLTPNGDGSRMLEAATPGHMQMVLEPKEVKDRLHCGLSTVYKLFDNHELGGYRVGRKVCIYAESVEAYKARHTNPVKLAPQEPEPVPQPRPRSHRPATPSAPRPFRHLR